MKINEIRPLDTEYTQVLDTIALKPKLLYYYGKWPEKRIKTFAIVGARKNSKYGEEVAYKLAYELAKHNVIVISGLAFGIDSIAHRGCLDAGGTTIAVLGTRIDDIYPKAHRPLATEIIKQNGAIISEYPSLKDSTAPFAPVEFVDELTGRRRIDQKISFLYRNRLIAGLSDIVVVVEAAERSGSLNTATHAIEQGKTVYAVPGNITSPYSQGCNKLIKQGALPYTEPSDILQELFPEEYLKKQKRLKKAHLIGDTDVETIILKAIAEGLRKGDDIMRATHLPPEIFNQTVTLLEIKGRIRSLGMNTWSLI